MTTSLWRWLFKECLRAGTVQVLQEHTVDSLNDLSELFKRRSKASGYENGKPTGAFELSHIWPVKTRKGDKTGLLHAGNLVLAPASPNRSHGSKCPTKGWEGIGLYVSTDALRNCYSVSKEDSPRDVERKIFKLLGATWQQFVALLVIQQSQQVQLRKKLEKKLGVKIPVHLSIEQLKAMAQEEDVSYFNADWDAHPASSVLQEELTRFGHVKDTEYGVYLSWLELYEEEFDFFTGGSLGGLPEVEQIELEKLLVAEVFAILHGQPILPREAKAQDLLLKLVTSQRETKSPTQNSGVASEDAELELEEWIL